MKQLNSELSAGAIVEPEAIARYYILITILNPNKSILIS